MRRSIRLFALLSALHFVALALPQAALAAAEGDEPGWEDDAGDVEDEEAYDEEEADDETDGSDEDMAADESEADAPEPPVPPPPPPPPAERAASEQEDTTIYKVVMNHEEQYSIWPADRENALGWNDAGKQGTKAECLAYIEEIWTDMRPLSLRKKMEAQAAE